MSIITTLRHHRRSIASATVAFGVLAAGTLFTIQGSQARHLDAVRSTVTTEGARVSAELSRAVDRRVFATQEVLGYATGAIEDGELDPDAFQDFARRVAERSAVPLRSVQLAPDAIVTYVYPLEGNEAAIGHDLLGDADRRQAVLDTIEAGTTMVAGPLDLIQGGTAIIARVPVFTGEDREFWGLATVLADWEPLLADAGLDALPDDVEVAVRGANATGADGPTFFGDEAVFAGDPITFDVKLPTGSWQLGIIPAGGWAAQVWPETTFVAIAGLIVALTIAVLIGRVVQARDDFRRLSHNLENLVDGIDAVIVEVDRAGVITSANRGAVAFAGLDASRLIGTPVRDVDELAGLRELILPALDGLDVGTSDFVQQGDAGERRFLADVSPRRGGGAIAIAQDVTDRVEVEAIRAENEAMARAGRLKDEFLAGMSHELRTPLNGIIGLSSILGKRTFGELNDKQSEYVGQIHASGKHLLSLINDVLDLAKMESRQEELELAPTDAARVATEAVDLVRELARSKGLRIDVAVQPELPELVADPRRVKQILVNLLSNAVKFTPQGAIGVEVSTTEADVRFTVWDTGIGIPAEKQRLLFRAFQQVDSTLDRAYEGTGLGLALSQRLAQLHGGQVEVSSIVGSGSRFTLVLPRPELAEDTAPAAPHGSAMAPAAPADATASAARALTVLLAEDNEINRIVMQEYLDMAGFRVEHVAEGPAVLAAVERVRPDVILMDIQLPGRNGLQVTADIKARPDLRHIPVIALTALAMPGDEQRCLDAGCDGYLSKPVEPDEVVARIRALASTPIA